MSGDFGYGQQNPNTAAHEFNNISFLVKQLVAEISTVLPGKVVAVHADHPSALGAAGTVDVLPLITQLDGAGNAQPHDTVYGMPYFRVAGGSNAVICDPEVDDVGFFTCAARDISIFKKTKAVANPGSLRKHNFADGIYLGKILSDAPEQYILFSATGVKIADKNGNVIETKIGGIFVTGNLVVGNILISGTIEGSTSGSLYAGDIKTSGAVYAGFGTGDQVGLKTHTHTSATAGNPTSAPNAGT